MNENNEPAIVYESAADNRKQQRLRNAVSSTMWTLVVAVYLLVSFVTMQWHITWLIFLVGALVQSLVSYAMGDVRKKSTLINTSIWTLAVIAYMLISFTTHQWFWACFIFLVAALVQQLVRLVGIWQEQ